MTPEELRARMGWAFRVSIPLPDVIDATPARIPLVLGIGVHGWSGRWAMNGARAGGVRIDVDPPCRARVCGFAVRLRTLWVSLTDPEGFLAALPPERRAPLTDRPPLAAPAFSGRPPRARPADGPS